MYYGQIATLRYARDLVENESTINEKKCCTLNDASALGITIDFYPDETYKWNRLARREQLRVDTAICNIGNTGLLLTNNKAATGSNQGLQIIFSASAWPNATSYISRTFKYSEPYKVLVPGESFDFYFSKDTWSVQMNYISAIYYFGDGTSQYAQVGINNMDGLTITSFDSDYYIPPETYLRNYYINGPEIIVGDSFDIKGSIDYNQG